MAQEEKREMDETLVTAQSKESVKEKEGVGDKEIWSWMQTETQAQINGC